MKQRPLDQDNRHPRLVLPRTAVQQALTALDQHPSFQCPPGELSLVFTTDQEIARIHGQFLQDPTPTDVITFPGDPELDFAGEIIVSVDTAHQYATRHQLDFPTELTLYLAHGFLHLCGWKDHQPEARAEMKKAESEAMALLQKRQLIPFFSLSQQP